jgi:carbamoyltransferase
VNIVGISSGYHDAACCIMRAGQIVAAVQEERFSRVKNDKSTPLLSFHFCLKQAGVSIEDIHCLAYYEDPALKLGRQIWMSAGVDAKPVGLHTILNQLTRESPQSQFRRVLGYEGRIEVVDHHLSHAASAYLLSPFDEAAVLTVDGVGDWPTTTFSRAAGARIERLGQIDFPHSLGLFYSALTSYLGFEVNEGEYKIMGLAPYGKPRYFEQISLLVNQRAEGRYELDLKFFNFLERDRMFSDALVALLGREPRTPEAPIEQFHMDVARSTQLVLEETMLALVKHLHRVAPCDALCMAGGVALNVVANARCLAEGPFRRLFVQPAAGDAGGALGAAAMAHARMVGSKPKPLSHVYLGPTDSSDAVYRLLKATSAEFRDFRGRESELLRVTARALQEGKVVGWCQGRCEFGPRALGARSILADPRRSDMRDRINALVKKREAFRPFAPSVLASAQAQHFALDHPSPYMLETCQVTSRVDMPAITHVDGSARVHTVDEQANPRFAGLLRSFSELTGCPVLLNTSFNLRGEPIVLTAVDAILCFVNSSIDLLVVEDFVLEREAVPALWQLMAHGRANAPPVAERSISNLVYTFF